MGHATTAIGAALAAALVRHERALARRWPRAIAADPASVHRARVASRRAREVLAVALVVDAGREAADLRRGIRRVTRALGPVRELDVALDELARGAARHDWAAEAVAAVRETLTRERARRARRLAAKAARSRRPWERRRLAALAAAMPLAADDRWLAALAERLARRAGAAVAAAGACGTLYAPEPLHALRIAVKKLRYALELVPLAVDEGAPARLRLLKTAQDRFGRLHDLQVLAAEVHALDARGEEAAGLALLREALERDCREVHAGAIALLPRIEAAARDTARRMQVHRASRRRTMAKAGLGRSPVPARERAARSGS
jgi:CHAD domain-containing protein